MTHRAFLQDPELKKIITDKIKMISKKRSKKKDSKYYKCHHEGKTFILAIVEGNYYVFAYKTRGSLASIYRSEYRVVIKEDQTIELKEDIEYALKLLTPARVYSGYENNIRNEMLLLSIYSGKPVKSLISQTKEVNQKQAVPAMLFKYIKGETLEEYLQSDAYKCTPLSYKLKIVKNLLQHYCEKVSEKHILHGDVNPKNIIICENSHNKHTPLVSNDNSNVIIPALIDFGTACAKLQSMVKQGILPYTPGAQPNYQAPEVTRARKEEIAIYTVVTETDEENSENCTEIVATEADEKLSEERAAPDVYALGIVCAQIITGKEINFFSCLEEDSDSIEKTPEFRKKDANREISECKDSEDIQSAIWRWIERMTALNYGERILISEAITEIEQIDEDVTKKSKSRIFTKADEEKLVSLELDTKGSTPSSVNAVEKTTSSTRTDSAHNNEPASTNTTPPTRGTILFEKPPSPSAKESKDKSLDTNYRWQIAAATAVMVTGYTALVLVCPPSLVLWALMAVPALAAGAAYTMDRILDYMSADKTTVSTALEMSV